MATPRILPAGRRSRSQRLAHFRHRRPAGFVARYLAYSYPADLPA